ncbi:MAG: hypothetical protein JXQ95_19180 [Alteromonas stellipolaris]|uniref:hypothetical protein n=1 Tax=Alteromonas stellipolaris TaxID=233316 RepID=UPI003B8CE248
MFQSLKLNSAKERLYEEKLYEQVASEIYQGQKRSGIWAKALALSNGSEELAKAKYIELRVQSLKDEIAVAKGILKQESQSIKRVVAEKTKNGWYLVCAVNDPEVVKLIKFARQRRSTLNQLKSLCLKMGLKVEFKSGFFRDSWYIEDQRGKNGKCASSSALEKFLVGQYKLLVG